MVDDCHTSSARPINLVDEHLSPTVIRIVRDHTPRSKMLLLSVNHFEELRCLGPWSCAHIQHDVRAADIEE